MLQRLFALTMILAMGMAMGCGPSTHSATDFVQEITLNDALALTTTTAGGSRRASAGAGKKFHYVAPKGTALYTTASYTATPLSLLPSGDFQLRAQGKINFERLISISSVEFLVSKGQFITLKTTGEMKENLSGKYIYRVYMSQDGIFTYNLERPFAPDEVAWDQNLKVYKFVDTRLMSTDKILVTGSIDGLTLAFVNKTTDQPLKILESTIGYIASRWMEGFPAHGVFWPMERINSGGE